MATLYARSNLATMTDPSGWSYTSGGVSAGLNPTNHDLVFDANSGNGRLIVGSIDAQSLKMIGSQPMTFSGTVNVKASSTLKGSFADFGLASGTSTWIDLDVADALFTNFRVYSSYCRITNGALLVSSNLGIQAGAFPGARLLMETPEKRIVASVLYMTQDPDASAFAYLQLEGGSLELTGVSGIFQYVAYLSGQLQMGLTGTVKFSNKSSAVKNIGTNNAQYTAEAWGNIINDTGTAGGLNWVTPNQAFASYNAGQGCVNVFASFSVYTASRWIIDGAGSYTTMYSDVPASNRATLQLPSTGQIIATNARFRGITMFNGLALNSINEGNTLNITFLKIFSRFFPFF